MYLISSVNSEYMDFAIIFFKSLIKIKDYKKLKRIYLIDHGLTRGQKKLILSISKKVFFINMFVPKIKFSRVHTDQWRQIISYKTKIFLKLLKIGFGPLIYIDIDSYINKNFLHLLNFENIDFIVCKRLNPQINQEGYKLDYIASFFAISKYHSKIDRLFDLWMHEMENIKGVAKETPALCLILPEIKKSLRVQDIEEDKVSLFSVKKNIEKFKKCSIFHLKSDGPQKKIERIIRLSDYGINLENIYKFQLSLLKRIQLEFKLQINNLILFLTVFLRIIFD